MVNGVYLRELRKKQKLTLVELSQETDCTASYLSQIERGLKEPSLPMLRKLSETLQVPMVSLLHTEQEIPESEQKSPSNIVTYAGQRPVLTLPNLATKSELLTPNETKMRGIVYTVSPGNWSSEDLIGHTYDECTYIFRGRMQAELENATYYLSAGDCIYITAHTKHNFKNCGDEELVAITFSS